MTDSSENLRRNKRKSYFRGELENRRKNVINFLRFTLISQKINSLVLKSSKSSLHTDDRTKYEYKYLILTYLVTGVFWTAPKSIFF